MIFQYGLGLIDFEAILEKNKWENNNIKLLSLFSYLIIHNLLDEYYFNEEKI